MNFPVALQRTLSGIMLLMLFAGPSPAQNDSRRPHSTGSVRLPTPPQLARIGTALLQWRDSRTRNTRDQAATLPAAVRPEQAHALEALLLRSPDARIAFDELGLPLHIRAAVLQHSIGSAQATAMHFLEENRGLLRLADPRRSLRLVAERRGGNGDMHLRYAQHCDQLRVLHADVLVHLNAVGDVCGFTARYAGDLSIRGSIGIGPAEAAAAVDPAKTGTKSYTHSLHAAAGKPRTVFPLPGMPAPSPELILLRNGDVLVPVYRVERYRGSSEPVEILVDARNGELYSAQSTLRHLSGPVEASGTDLLGNSREFGAWQRDDLTPPVYWLVDGSRPMFDPAYTDAFDGVRGTIVTADAQNTPFTTVSRVISLNNTWMNPATVSAHANARMVYDYFHDTHGKTSLDERGGGMLSIVNVAAEGGGTLDRAYWNGRFVAYGTGNSGMKNLAAGLDIAAHEWVHAVVESSAGLRHGGQSGALCEAICDVFACMIDREDWWIGEDVVIGTDTYPSGRMRDLSAPSNWSSPGDPGWQASAMSEYAGNPLDDYDRNVHVNSGIPAHAMYLIAEDIGREKAERILFDAVTGRLVSAALFVDFRLAVIASAEDLYGTSSSEVTTCVNAFDAVGIPDGTANPPPAPRPPVDGIDRILFVNTDEFLPATLWVAVPPAQGDQDFTSLSFTPVTGRPSVTDDGSTALFIDDENNLRVISLTGDPAEQVLDGSGIWNGVAVSRDGKRVALTTVSGSSIIFVLDISGPTPVSRSFTVEVPGYNADGMRKPDPLVESMEFGHDDEQLLLGLRSTYTVHDRNREFRDVALIDIWDAGMQEYRDGKTHRVLPSGPPAESSNPVWSQTRPNLIAFDHVDEAGTAYVAIVDVYSGNRSLLPVSSTPAQPCFSATDSLITYVHDDAGVTILTNQRLMPDGMTPTGSPSGFILFAERARWLRTGDRPVDVAPPATVAGFSLQQNYPNPFLTGTWIPLSLDHARDVQLRIYDATGALVRTVHDGRLNAGVHQRYWDGRDTAGSRLPAGVYYAMLSSGTLTVYKTMLLLK